MAIRSVKQHIVQDHAKIASFVVGVASELGKFRKVFEELETQADEDSPLKPIYRAGKESVDRLSASFMEHGQHHRTMGESAEKADEAEDLSKRLVPTDGVVGVYDPRRAPAGKLVPRTGQPTHREMPKVDMQFEHLVRVEE